jgi:hypothetical protein
MTRKTPCSMHTEKNTQTKNTLIANSQEKKSFGYQDLRERAELKLTSDRKFFKLRSCYGLV